ncbi:DUF6377 domain-containing protein [Sphingobacterium sp. SYP-B4668]|uniref:DUF6377 domain-containing protein n=1 Tax=Sphingobacterium sp. SYP-B4668 TaxID=2996035 RepID=UPI0022DD65E9|nr:DUF6377 domain-containing protein [Sphingobacterium sp. SYP-B4668]
MDSFFRSLLIFCFSITLTIAHAAQDSTLIYHELDKAMDNQAYYVQKRQDALSRLKQEAKQLQYDHRAYFDKNYQIFENYKKFQSDSAISYLNICQKLSANMHDSLTVKVKLDLAWLYSTVGRYIEAQNILNTLHANSVGPALKYKYYETYSSFYSHYGQSNNITVYYQKSEIYRDSLLMSIPQQSDLYKLTYATKVLFKGDREQAKTLFLPLLARFENNLEKHALVAYFLGIIYKQEKDVARQQYYYSVSAYADVISANKDNASLQELALTYYEAGNFDKAFLFIEKAIDDAMYCNVRYRVIEGTSFYPIINAAYQQKINDQNRKLSINLILISILSIVLIAGIIVIYRQMKYLNKIQQELSLTNGRLQTLNEDLSLVNNRLSESNHIKEEYIAQFFDMCSSYIDKMESLRKVLLKQATNNQIKPLIEYLKSTKMVEAEVQELYNNFDSIFLNLYPTFVHDFNHLLQDQEHILPKKGELLNTELRIFALIRLGITDSVKIASFLRYSLRTVYNYRTKVRNKAAVSRSDFEDLVRHIGVMDR